MEETKEKNKKKAHQGGKTKSGSGLTLLKQMEDRINNS